MKSAISIFIILALAACGIDTASTAATAAALKKQEIEQGQKTMQQFQQSLDQANQQVQQRTEQATDSAR